MTSRPRFRMLQHPALLLARRPLLLPAELHRPAALQRLHVGEVHPLRHSSKPPTLKLRRSNCGGRRDFASAPFLFMNSIRVAAATKDRWPDVRALFEGHGERGCWCQYWRQSSSAYSNAAPGSGESNLRQQVNNGPAPGLIAYLDEEPVG